MGVMHRVVLIIKLVDIRKSKKETLVNNNCERVLLLSNPIFMFYNNYQASTMPNLSC